MSIIDGDIWICKPSGRNQGKGIFLVTELSKLKSVLEKDDKKMGKSMIRIIQRFVKVFGRSGAFSI